MNDKDFKEVLENIFGLDAEALQAKFTENEPTEDEKREFALGVSIIALESGGFTNALIVAKDNENLAVSIPKNPSMAANLILSALKHAPKETLEIIYDKLFF